MESYVEMAESRIGKELSSQKGFLALDFQDPLKVRQGKAGGPFRANPDQADAVKMTELHGIRCPRWDDPSLERQCFHPGSPA